MATFSGNFNPQLREKSAAEKGLAWAKAHQEIVAVSVIVLLLMGIGIPYYFHSQDQNEKDAQGVLSLGQYYLHAQVDPQKGPFKSVVERNQNALQTFQRILTDYSGTKTTKIARYYVAKCQYDLGQLQQAYGSFDAASQQLKDNPLGDEAYFGKILCLEAQNQLPQSITLAETFLKDRPDSFITAELRLNLSDIYLKSNDKAKALDQLKEVSKDYPDSDWGKEADRRLKDFQS
jgi:tetratricopeptide (TPR) repeat protein